MLPEPLPEVVTEFMVTETSPPPSHCSTVERPEPLTRFARGFLRTRMDAARFLWHADGRWHAVTLERQAGGEGQSQALVTYAPVSLPAGVTNREIDVLTLISLGLTNAEIAARLGNSTRTVSTQVERLLVKLGQAGRGGLAAIAVDSGLIHLPVPGGVDGVSGLALVEIERLSGPGHTAATSNGVRVTFPRRRSFVLGTVMSSLGNHAADGIETMRGAALAVAEINKAGGVAGRSIEHVVTKADIYDEVEVRKAFQQLVDRQVDAITTSYVSAENPFVLDMVADYGCPFLHTATLEAQVRVVRENPVRYRAVFQTCPSETYYGPAFVRFLDSLVEQGLWLPRRRRVLSVEVAAKSTQIANDVLLSSAARSGWDIAEVLGVPAESSNWTEVVERIRALDVDAVIVSHWDAEMLAVLQRAIYALRLPVLVHYVYGASTTEFTQAAGTAAEGVIWSTVTGRYDDSLGRRFQERYRAMFGAQAGWSAASASYDQVRLLAGAWSAVGRRDFDRVAEHLRSTVHRGLNGVYYLADPGQSPLCYPDSTLDPSLGQALMTYQIQDGHPRALAPAPLGTLSAFRTPAWFPALTST
jgi:branched-chain amino acid transport system substrate-binding protein